MIEESTCRGHDTAQRTDKLGWKTDARSVSVRTDGLTDSQRRAPTDVHVGHFWQARRLRIRAGTTWTADLPSPFFFLIFFFHIYLFIFFFLYIFFFFAALLAAVTPT